MFDKLAIIDFSGYITSKKAETFIKLISQIKGNKHIKGILIRINSGGGDAIASGNLYRAIKSLSAKKPVISFVNGIAASGAYEMACGTKKIYAVPESLIGSIGVISIKPVIQGLMEKLGIEVEITKMGENKDDSLPFKKSSESSLKTNKENMAIIYKYFVNIVSNNRNLPIDKVLEIANGDVYIAEIAKNLNLIDGISTEEGAIEELRKMCGAPLKTVEIIPPKPFLTRLLNLESEMFQSFLLDMIGGL